MPVQKILRNGRTVTVFTVGTGGMFDQRVIGPENLPKPAQWHRIAVHNDSLGAYAVQKLVKKYVVEIKRSSFSSLMQLYLSFSPWMLLYFFFYVMSVQQSMLRVILKPGSTMTALMIKSETYLRSVFDVMVC